MSKKADKGRMVIMEDEDIRRGDGRRRTISISKIRKMTASRKNRREKGTRADLLGSKPHSKGEFFSRSNIFFMEIVEETKARAKIRSSMHIVEEKSRIMIYTGCYKLLSTKIFVWIEPKSIAYSANLI